MSAWKYFETAPFFVNARNLREAKAAMRDVFENGYGKGELEAEIVGSLREVKPTKPPRKAPGEREGKASDG